MKGSVYRSIALNNIRKNYRFFIPRIIAEAGLLACFYIALTLALDGRLASLKGGEYIPTFMYMAVAILALLSAVLLLYTNSFLMKQRTSEFGLYNVLGMEKKHISKVLFRESAVSSLISVVLGLLLGVLFYKLCSLFICRLLQSDIILGFYFITPENLILSASVFILFDLFIFGINVIRIAGMKPAELLSSRASGEKEPKVKIVLFILGLISLGAGYYLSLSTKSPIQALGLFFLAVILVIIGTYFLFVSGSIFVLKALKKNKKYYYQKNHMPAVSGLLYRMKQNAVGLASIAILACGVLVMISSTVSLYAGLSEVLSNNYPHDMYFSAEYTEEEGTKTTAIPAEKLELFVREAAERNGVKIKSVETNQYVYASFYAEGNTMYADGTSYSTADFLKKAAKMTNVLIITEETYTSLTGEKLGLSGNDIVTCRISSPADDIRDITGVLTIEGRDFTVAGNIYSFPINIQMVSNAYTTYGIVVSGDDILSEISTLAASIDTEEGAEYVDRICVTFEDLDAACEKGEKLVSDTQSEMEKYISGKTEKEITSRDSDELSFRWTIDTYWKARENLIGMYGSLLFLGILLGSVCMFATVLIIYYKQISEGYEDRQCFRIMEKIGMSKTEVKKTISSQVLIVFFLPLVAAGIHILFAYPLLTRLLKVLMMQNPTLFLTCSLICFGVFVLVYILIYLITSKTYYKIVQ